MAEGIGEGKSGLNGLWGLSVADAKCSTSMTPAVGISFTTPVI